MKQVDIIMGLFEGYGVSDLTPFLCSLRATDFRGDVVFFTRNRSYDLIAYLERENVRIQRYARARLSIFTRPVHGALNIFFQVAARIMKHERALFQFRLAQYFWNIQASRYFHYLDYLRKHADRYRYVMLTDVRDVYFQTNPFAEELAAGVHVFEEFPGVCLGEQKDNREWISFLFGKEILERLRSKPIVCSGVTLGTTGGVLDYLEAMTNVLAKKSGPVGFDQGVHNYLIREGGIRKLHIYPFNKAPVMHLGISPRSEFLVHNDGLVVDCDGSICSVVHQYDRHPELREYVNKRFRGA